jgi:hypothetical protein
MVHDFRVASELYMFNLLMTDQLAMLLKFILLLIQKNVNSNEHAEFLEKISI